MFYDSRERKEGGREKERFLRTGPNRKKRARGPSDSLPVFIKGAERAPGKKRNIRATQSVSPVPYVVLRPLPLWLLISPFPPAFAFAFAFSSFLPVPRRGYSPLIASLSFSLAPFHLSRPPLGCIARGGIYSRGSTRTGEKDSVARIVHRRRSEDLSRTSASAPSWCRRIGVN